MRPDKASGYPGRTHRFYTGEPVFKFGDGLSFTAFERTLAWAAPAVVVLDNGVDGDPDRVVATVEASVTNIGARDGDEVLLLFVVAPPAALAAGAPIQQLAAFERVALRAGETSTIMLQVTQRHVILPVASRHGDATRGPWQLRLNQDVATAVTFTVSYI